MHFPFAHTNYILSHMWPLELTTVTILGELYNHKRSKHFQKIGSCLSLQKNQKTSSSNKMGHLPIFIEPYVHT
jgi:hypothetical protein